MALKNSNAQLIAGALVVLGAAGFGGWQYYQSPEPTASRQLRQAERARSAGQLKLAAELFGGVAQSRTSKAADGKQGLRGLLDAGTLKTLPPADAAAVLAQVPPALAAGQSPLPAPEVAALGWALIAAHQEKDAAGAKALVDAIRPVEPDQARLAAAAEPLLERIVAADGGNAVAAIEYAELLDRRGACGRCEALLARHAASLGSGEAARILGRIYAGKGMFNESYALLQPYTQEKLKRFVEREAEYRTEGEATEKVAIQTLRSGAGPADFYKAYDAADEARKRELVANYVDERLAANTRLKALAQALRESSAIVPVALDLGIVTVQRAQQLTDPAARNAQFAAAEKVFLSIRSLAGGTDGYRLYLGQVHYWLGKQAEGKKLFDELLAAHGRGYAVLVDVAAVLRSVGAVQEARALAEEGYGKSKDDQQRWNAAHLRSVMQTDPEDELRWLERCDRSIGRIRASIHTTRAQLANNKGQRAAAKREFEAAAAELAKLPESAAQLNDSGLVDLALYGMEGDPLHLQQGLARLDQALALMPTDSALLNNNISAVSAAAVAAILGDKVNLPLLRASGEFEFLEFLHNDEASRERVRQAVRDNEAVKKALAYSDKAALISPRNPRSYAFSVAITGLLEDAPAMAALATRARASQLDLADTRRELQKTADGVEVKQQIEAMLAYSQQLAAVRGQPMVQRHPATSAVAAGRWVDTQIGLWRWGHAVDLDAVVDVARKARSAHPSAGAQAMLVDALETRAAMRLAKSSASFAATLAKHGRVISPDMLLVMHVEEDPEFRRLALADPDLLEIMGLMRDRDRRYPNKASPWTWAMFHHADPAYAQSLADRLRRDASYPAYFQLNAAFHPEHPEATVSHYLYALATAGRPRAQQLLEEARKAGIALPELLGRQPKT